VRGMYVCAVTNVFYQQYVMRGAQIDLNCLACACAGVSNIGHLKLLRIEVFIFSSRNGNMGAKLCLLIYILIVDRIQLLTVLFLFQISFLFWWINNTYFSRFIPEGVAEVSQIFLRDTHVVLKLVSYEEYCRRERW
jgi:hypothetical protein